MNKMIKYFVLISLILFSPRVFGQEWIVPTENSEVRNPIDYNLENVKIGKDLYLKNCKSCHGDPGKNNVLPLVPPPPDVMSEKMQKNSEGDIFYKITIGKATMPQFETTISEDNRWRLVNFIMNYNPKRIALLIDAPPVKAKLSAVLNEEATSLGIYAEFEDKSGGVSKLKDAGVIISLKKTFGNLEIAQIITDNDGKAEFVLPHDILGDSLGLASLVVSLGEDFEAEEVIIEKAGIGIPVIKPLLIKRGVLWSTNEYVPFWLLFSYIGIVGGAWLTIGYVIFQIVKIKKYSKL